MEPHTILHSGRIPTNSAGGLSFLHILSSVCYLYTLMTAILNSVKWYHTVVFIYILSSLAVWGIFSCACWSSVCLLWKSVYSGLLLIFRFFKKMFSVSKLYVVYIFTCNIHIYLYIHTHIWPQYEACGILIPWPGTEPMPLAVKVWSPNHWTARRFMFISFGY